MVMQDRIMVISRVGVGEVGGTGTDWEGACKKVMGLVMSYVLSYTSVPRG